MRLPIAPAFIIPAARASGYHPTPPDRQTYVDDVIIPMRRHLPPGQTRDGRPNGLTFEPAPGWAATLVDQLATLVLDDSQDYAELLRLTRRLLETEERALAALTVIESTCKREKDVDGEPDGFRRLGVFSAAVLMKKLDALP